MITDSSIKTDEKRSKIPKVFKKMNDIIEEKSVMVPLYYDEVYRFYSNDLSDVKTNSFNALLLKEAKKNIK